MDAPNDGDKLEYKRINCFHDNLPLLTSLNATKALDKVEECLELLRQLQLGEAHFVPIFHFGCEISRHGLQDLLKARSYLEREVMALEGSQGEDSYGAIDTRNLLQKLDSEISAYFVHSYNFLTSDENNKIMTADYGQEITAMISQNNIVGTQFHPEKSNYFGLIFLETFLELEKF